MPTLSDYLQLVPSWNSDKPRFMNTLALLLQPMVDAQAMLAKLTADFDIDTAVGVQLDMVGQWVGHSRWVEVPIEGVYFSFDLTDNVGFDQGVWLRPYDSGTSRVPIADDVYRELLKFKIAANEWDSTVPSINPPLQALFPGLALIDKGDLPTGLMAMNVLFPLLTTQSLAMVTQAFFVKPSGVRVSMFESTVANKPMFGFDVESTVAVPAPIAGFDEGAWGTLVFEE